MGQFANKSRKFSYFEVVLSPYMKPR